MNKKLVLGALVLTTLLGAAGGTAFNAIAANAQTATSNTTQTTTNPPSDQQVGPTKGGHVGTNGIKEVLLTGDTADKVKAAALAKVPGATIERVETDAEGSPNEAHMVTSDGKHETVKVDSNFNATTVEEGPMLQKQN